MTSGWGAERKRRCRPCHARSIVVSQTQPLSGPCECTTDLQGITHTHEEQLGADLLEFLNATNERAAHESCHVHA